jgi:hypothetical protein
MIQIRDPSDQTAKTYALDRVATGTSFPKYTIYILYHALNFVDKYE